MTMKVVIKKKKPIKELNLRLILTLNMTEMCLCLGHLAVSGRNQTIDLCHILPKPQLNTVCCREGSEVACLLSGAFGNDRGAQSVGFPLMDCAVGYRKRKKKMLCSLLSAG